MLKAKFTASKLPIDFKLSPEAVHLYPKCLSTCSHELAVEFRYLLPDTPAIRAILPVLMVGYIVKRRGQESDYYSEPISRLLYSLLTHDKPKISYYMREITKQFRLPSWDKVFTRLEYKQLENLSTLEQKLSLSGTAVLFLFLAYKTHELCNLPLSFALFEKHTGCLSLFDDVLMDRLGTSVDTEDKALHAELVAYLISIFGTDDEPTSSIAIDRFIMNFIAAIISREIDSYLAETNKWAYDNIYTPYKQHCASCSGIRWIFDPDKSNCPSRFSSLSQGTQDYLLEEVYPQDAQTHPEDNTAEPPKDAPHKKQTDSPS